MKFRKPLAFLLTLALLLGTASIAGASGAVDGQSTTLWGGTVTQADTPEPPEFIQVIDDKINVTITNIQYAIQVNPYGMDIKYPDDSGTSTDSIVAVPLYIENNTDVPVEVTAKATAVPYGNVTLDSKPTRYAYEHYPLENPDNVPSDERVYLYLQMMKLKQFSSVDNAEWAKLTEKEVITQDGGSKELKVEMPVNGGAALKIGGNTSLPTAQSYNDGVWREGNGFDVHIVLSFLPKREEGYYVTFDVKDIVSSKKLVYPVSIELQGVVQDSNSNLEIDAESKKPPKLVYNKDQQEPQTVQAKESLTFTIKSAESFETNGYLINEIWLVHLDSSGNEIADSNELMYPVTDEEIWSSIIIEHTNTINASKVTPGQKLKVKIIVEAF